MNLEDLITQLQAKRLKDSDDALKNIANAEKYLQQSYEGRYIFELIQNARDANKLNNTTGYIQIILSENELIVSNSGAPFSERGINSVTTIGDSPKESQEFIGFKGIGFKSVHEISDAPKIVTEWGSIVFDKHRTETLLNGRAFKNRDIPLFFIPHYDKECLTLEDKSLNIVTKIILPIKERFDSEKIEKAFAEIGVHQILLLGHLEQILLSSKEKKYEYQIIEDKRTDRVEIINGENKYQFKHYRPSQKIEIPKTIIQQLEDKEKEIYKKEPLVDISIIFDIDKNNKFIQSNKSKLFLYYPTEITSGFNFIIHSYFLVTPDRKALRDSILNKHLLKEIGNYLGGEWLAIAKKNHKSTFLDFLAFERNSEVNILNSLYDSLIEKLRNQKFLYDRHTNKFYRLTEVIIAEGFDKGLFPNNMLNGKRLIYVHNGATRDWLIREFKISYLSYNTIAENIERECIRQQIQKNFKFFENLYKYLVEYDDLNLKGKKILLTSKQELLSSEDYVFYGLKEKINFPPSVQDKIHFIHSAIKISDQRQGKGQTGLIEFNTELLVRRLLKLYDEKTVLKEDILASLLSLNISERLLPEIRQKILLPIKANVSWQNPLSNPIYIETQELLSLYPIEKFVDLTRINSLTIDGTVILKKLVQYGAWKIPAIYYSPRTITVNHSDQRFEYIYRNIKSFSTPYFDIHGDWNLDLPEYFDSWFTQVVISNWTVYVSIIENDGSPVIKFKSQTSDLHHIPKDQRKYIVSLTKYLREGKWIKIDNDDQILQIKDVIGVDPLEILQQNSFLFKKYMKVLPIHFQSNSFLLSLLNLKHLDTKRVLDLKAVLLNIESSYNTKIDLDKDFIAFYNKILGKLFDLYSWPNINKLDFNTLTDVKMPGINELQQKLEWKPAREIYYIEDKPAYDLLPLEIKSLIQPHFTNRDKNRFGQIAKRIGLDFKKTIKQKLEYDKILNSYNLWDWVPYFFETIGLVEILLEANLDVRLEILKKIKVHVSTNLKLHLYKDGVFVTTLSQIQYCIQSENGISVFVSDTLSSEEQTNYANIVHDILVDVLGRDLHRVRLSLNDFFTRKDKEKFLESFEVTKDRIEEIILKMKGIILTRRQAFWLAILNTKHIQDPTSYLSGDDVDLVRICSSLSFNCGLDNHIELKSIDYDNISAINNMQYLMPLFQQLDIDISNFNEVAEFEIDFKEFYKSQFEGIKAKYKPIFERKLHAYLTRRSIDEKSKFQDRLDEYTDSISFNISYPLLWIDVIELYLKNVTQKYPYIELTKDSLTVKTGRPISPIFKKNLSFITKELKLAPTSELFQGFISFNSNRSLFYFDDTEKDIIEIFEGYCKKISELNRQTIEGNIADLSKYVNSANTVITPLFNTERINKESRGAGSSNGKGKRVDGSNDESNKQLIGIVAEKLVYEKLSKEFQTVEWVSKNAARAGINPEGSDVHGFDIKYVDHNDFIHYIEVKGKNDFQRHFYISYSEYLKAILENERYHIVLVLNTLKNDSRQIFDLGNIFSLNETEDIFTNPRFTANFSSLEISFK